jgi:SAM-dependent methyltransferase
LKDTVKATNVFDEMGSYWAEIADQSATERQMQFIKNAVKKEGWILDLACGSGRHTIPLTNQGYSVLGLDISARLLKIAKQRLPQAQLAKADMRFLPFNDGVFAAALSIDNSFGYFPSEEADLQSLKELRRTLSKEGIYVLDVFNREHLLQKYGKHRSSDRLKWLALPMLLKFHNRLSKKMLFWFYNWKEYPSFYLMQKRTVSKAGGRLCDLWVIYDKADGQFLVFKHLARLYKFSRLQELLFEAGFLVNRVYGDYERQDFSADSNRLIILANTK